MGTVETEDEQESGQEDEQEVVESSEDDEIQDNMDIRPEIELLLPGTFVLVKYVSGKKRKCTSFKYVCKKNFLKMSSMSLV